MPRRLRAAKESERVIPSQMTVSGHAHLLEADIADNVVAMAVDKTDQDPSPHFWDRHTSNVAPS